ncbi:hypothetical protein HU200_004735 [Digitaria exilis]|uniref:Uncharacterized protein n=1 Tax=Digitaria exilis TaxID=1010633 RepID=A0A835FS24_9POAL|nr:hypothetical protein HU200_004735 [Digitaria exilis]CAB3474809.1 unnamed protein product [Digitaria exilis]
MSSTAGGYGHGGAGSGSAAEHNCHGHGDFLLHHHAQHVAAAQQLYHVPQHSRREKLRFPPDDDSPPQHHHHHAGAPAAAWPPPPPGFYSYASSSSTSSYSPHSPTTLAQQAHQLVVAHGGLGPPPPPPLSSASQIPTHNFALSLSSSSSNPPPPPPTQARRPLAAPSSGPFGPFTGYAAVLGRSRFLAPAEKLLEEICDVGGAASHVDRTASDEGLLDADPMEGIDHDLDGAERAAASDAGPISGAEQQWKKTKLISMMEEVCKRYRLYYQQVQTVINSFETVAGFSNAAPFAAMALRAMAKHFKCLKSMILSQLRNTSKAGAGKEGLSKDIAIFGLASGSTAIQRASSVAAFGHPHNIWRPQRGLPERAVSVLRAWLFEHFLHPYPTDGDKQMLAKQTGLTRNQVSNWFINARVRLWKPMVEEIHNLEMRQVHKHPALENHKSQHAMHHQAQHSSESIGKPSDPSDSQLGQSSSITRNHAIPASQGFPDELSQMPHSIQQGQVTFSYNGLSTPQHQHGLALSQQHHQQVGPMSGIGGPGNGGVSLTLGLHQNNRVCIAEPLPASLPPNLAHRFGLEEVSDAYMMGSFGGQDRHFGKEIGGHLVHDFVG